MHVQDLKLSKRLTELLLGAGLDTIERVHQAGREGLTAIDGIGPASADDILAAAARLGASLEEKLAQPTLPKNAPSQASLKPETPPNANEPISVRNASAAPVLVGGKYMFPGDVRTIRRHLMKPGLVVQDSGA